MIHRGPTDKNTRYHVLSVTPAATYDGACAPTVYVSTDAQAISNLRDNLIRNEDVNHAGGPQVYTMHRMTIPDDLRRAMVDQQIQRSSFGAPVQVAPTGMLSQDRDAIVGRDYFHEQSQWMAKGYKDLRDVVTGVRTEMQVRDQVLQPFAQAAAKTYSPEFIITPENKDALLMAYAGIGIQHETIKPAIARMAEKGLDTAIMAPDFQKEYEAQLDALTESRPGAGRHELQNEALMSTAFIFQTQHCGNFMDQQAVFMGITVQCRNVREQCAQLDAQERTNAFGYAGGQVMQYMQNYGQYLSNEQRQLFAMTVNQRVGELQRTTELTNRTLEGVIRDTAKEFAAQARETGDHRASFNFNNIADAAEHNMEAMERAENDSLDDISVDD